MKIKAHIKFLLLKGSLSTVIEELQLIPSKYTNFSDFSIDNGHLYGYREETKSEMEYRVKRENQDAIRAKKKEKKEYEMYQKLKEKFEKS